MQPGDLPTPKFQALKYVNINNAVSAELSREGLDVESVRPLAREGTWDVDDAIVRLTVSSGAAKIFVVRNSNGDQETMVCYSVVCWDPAFSQLVWKDVRDYYRKFRKAVLAGKTTAAIRQNLPLLDEKKLIQPTEFPWTAFVFSPLVRESEVADWKRATEAACAFVFALCDEHAVHHLDSE